MEQNWTTVVAGTNSGENCLRRYGIHNGKNSLTAQYCLSHTVFELFLYMLCTISNFQYNLLWPADQKKQLLFQSKVQISQCSNVSKCCQDKNHENEDAGCDRLSVDSFSPFVSLFCELDSSRQFHQINWLWHDKPHWDSISRQGEHYEYSKA